MQQRELDEVNLSHDIKRKEKVFAVKGSEMSVGKKNERQII